MASVLENLVQSITIETNWTPPIVLADPFAPGPPSPILKFLKPRITITPKAGDPIVSAPWGQPTENNWDYAKWVLLGVGMMAVVGVADLVIYRAVKPRGRARLVRARGPQLSRLKAW